MSGALLCPCDAPCRCCGRRAPAQLEAEQLAAARAAAAEQERAREAAWLAQPRQVVLDTQRPWNAASSTYYMSPEVEEAARRRGQREASDANRLISQRRAAHDAQQHAAEQDALRRDYQAEVRCAARLCVPG